VPLRRYRTALVFSESLPGLRRRVGLRCLGWCLYLWSGSDTSYCYVSFLQFLGLEEVVMVVPLVEPATGMPVGGADRPFLSVIWLVLE